MRKILAIFAVCLLVILPLKLLFVEEQEQHFYIQLQPMYMNVQGIDEHVGDIVKYREQWDGLTLDYRWYNDQVATTFHAPDRGPEDFWQLAKRTLKF